jgi:hypothetical protein
MQRGVVYIADGLPYVAMMSVSLRSLKKHNPDIPVTVASRQSKFLLPGGVWSDKDRWLDISLEQYPRNITPRRMGMRSKSLVHSFTSCPEAVFLDCDTIVNRNFDRYFDQLAYYDILIRPEPGYETGRDAGEPTGIGKSISDLPYFNSGVFFFRNSESTADCFRLWRTLYDSLEADNDQHSLSAALATTNVRIGPLSELANCFTNELRDRKKRENCVIHHYTSNINRDLQRTLEFEMREICRLNQVVPSEKEKNFFSNRIADRVARGKSDPRSTPVLRRIARRIGRVQ